MTDLHYVALPNRSIVSVSGNDAVDFLQGLITNDIELVTPERAIYAALLTPQGKYLHDFCIFRADNAFFLDCEKERLDDLITRLKRYRLRAQVDIQETETQFKIYALIGSDAVNRFGLGGDLGTVKGFAGGFVYNDPRDLTLGARACLPGSTGEQSLQDAGFTRGEIENYNAHRFAAAIADGAPEIEPEKSYPMEYGLDLLNGVSFSKGCYVGQEVTVRMKNRDLARKCLVSVKINGHPPAIGTPIDLDGVKAGELRGATGDVGLALVRKDLLDQASSTGSPFTTNDAQLFPTKN